MGAASNYRRSLSGYYYPYAARYLEATGITNPALIAAIKWLVNRFLLRGWLHPISPGLSKLKAVWPILGGTADAHRYNLVNTDLYALTYYGNVTHSATGMRFDGLTGFADTHLSLPSALTNSNVGLGAYLRDNQGSRGGYQVDIGVIVGGVYTSLNVGGTTYYGAASREAVATRPSSNTQGLWHTQSNGYMAECWLNGNLLASQPAGFVLYDTALGLGGCYYNGGSPDLLAVNEHAFDYASEYLTPQEMSYFTSDVQTFQIMAGRQV